MLVQGDATVTDDIVTWNDDLATRWTRLYRLQPIAHAAALAHSMPYPCAEARSLHEWGVMFLHQGNESMARENLQEALAIFHKLGSAKDVERTETALAGHPLP